MDGEKMNSEEKIYYSCNYSLQNEEEDKEQS